MKTTLKPPCSTPAWRGPALLALTFVLLATAPNPAPAADDFRLTLAFGPDGRPRLYYDASATNYYILLAGDTVTNVLAPATMAPTAMTLGSDSTGTLTDPRLPLGLAGFYRAVAVPIANPLDTDGDGIDDVFELRHPNILNPLNPTDAHEDYDGDGFTNLEEYQSASNLEGPVDTVSREFTVFYVPDSDLRKAAVSRELTVFYAPDSAPNKQAVSRELTMFVLPAEPAEEAISRELTVENVRLP